MRNHYVTPMKGIEGYLFCTEVESGDRVLSSSPPLYSWVADKNGNYQPIDEADPITEHEWVKSELISVDLELMYHWAGDAERLSATEAEWKHYAITLRNYTTIDEQGVISIVGVSRPQKPE